MSDPHDPHKALWREYFEDVADRNPEDAVPETRPPQWPLISGIFTFPWYPDTIGVWLGMSLSLILTGLGFGVLLGPAMQAGVIGVRAMGAPVGVLTALTLSYASACCLHVIENTANGVDSISSWPATDWREWVWSFISVLYVFVLCALAGYGLRLVILPVVDTWLPSAFIIFLLFPVVLLSSLAADSRWWPHAPIVLRSLKTVPIHWLFFYGVATALCSGWLVVTVVMLLISPVGTPLVVMPLLAAVMLICARLLGRLAWCMGQIENSVEKE